MQLSVHCFPSIDYEFKSRTQNVLAESWEKIRESGRVISAMDELIAEVQNRLREEYPAAVVRLKDAQAELGEPEIQTLYAFRDGRAA